jgi:CBS domain-containing membrane protein
VLKRGAAAGLPRWTGSDGQSIVTEMRERPHQHHGELGDVVHGLLVRLRIRSPAQKRRESVFWLGMFALVNGGISTALMALGARLTGEPLLFPSLGPTAFMLFYQPSSPAACPRNALLGHLIGILVGYGSLRIFGLEHARAVLTGGMTWGWIGSASLSLAVTAGLMVWLRVPHPPAAATTLIVSLGILPRPAQLIALFTAIVALVVQGLVINRVAGVRYPIWGPGTAHSRGRFSG